MNNRLNIEQKRAKTAFDFADKGNKAAFENNGQHYKPESFGTNATKVPMYIKTNGLGNTVAFIYSKRTKDDEKKGKAGTSSNSKNAWSLIYEQIRFWLEDEEHSIIAEKLKAEPQKELIKHITELETEEYRSVTKEVLALFSWIKRFVKDEQ